MALTGSSLDRTGFELLLTRIGEPEHYEELRRRLIAYFRWEQCREPEPLADEVIDRLARRLASGTDIADPNAYAAGIARLVIKEYRASLLRQNHLVRELNRQAASAPAEAEIGSADLEDCLRQLSATHRDQIIAYYQGDFNLKMQNRRTLARQLGLVPNALRNRMMRLRKLLAACLAARQKSQA